MREVTIAYGMTETSPVSFQTGAGRSARAPRLHRRPHPAAPARCKIVDAEGRIVPRGHAGRAVHARLFGDARLLGRCRAHRRGDRRARLDAHRRPRRPSTPRATATSSAASRTWSSAAARTSIRARSRSSSTAIPKIADVQVFGVPDPKYGEELCAWIKLRDGRDADRGGDPRLLPRPDRPLQDPALRPLRRRVPDDGHRQDAEVPDARSDAARVCGRRGAAALGRRGETRDERAGNGNGPQHVSALHNAMWPGLVGKGARTPSRPSTSTRCST